MKIFRLSFQFKKIAMFLCEGLLIFVSGMAAVYLRLGTFHYDLAATKSFLSTAVFLISLYYADLYNPRVIRNMRELLIGLFQAMGVAYIILAVIYYLYPPLIIGRGISLVSAVLILCLIVSWRLLYRRFLMSRGMEEKILIIGTNTLAEDLAREIANNRTLGYRLAGFIDRTQGRLVGNPSPVPVIGDFNDLERIVEEQGISRIVVALDERRGRLPVETLLASRMKGVVIEEGVGFYEGITGKILVERLRPSWLIFSRGFEHSLLLRLYKRWAGLLVSTAGLLLLLPLILVIALLIKIDSRGPVFFKQERIGEGGRVFTLYKFRSMFHDAEEATGPTWADPKDARTTRVGRYLRKTRFDEIPQLFNVLRGDMSIVGPRPERPYFVERLCREIPYYANRHAVKPGITGWAQVRYSYGASEEDAKEKLQYDLYYIKNMSLFLDLGILVDTLKVVFLGRGAR